MRRYGVLHKPHLHPYMEPDHDRHPIIQILPHKFTILRGVMTAYPESYNKPEVSSPGSTGSLASDVTGI